MSYQRHNSTDGEPWRDQFGPEDFESEHDAQDRRRTERETLKRAELLRVGLRQFARNFDIRVSDDARSGAMCYHCKAMLTGDRANPAKLPRLLRTHACAALESLSAPVWPVVEIVEEVFS